MTDSHRTDISFITICYNGFKDTCELIESLQEKLHSVTYEIIVVDNASREDEAAKISRLYPSVIAIRSEVNRGFSGGNNIGIRAARGKYLFFINNDTYIESDAISCLVERLESRPEIGGVSLSRRSTYSSQASPPCRESRYVTICWGSAVPMTGNTTLPTPLPTCMAQP